MNQVNIKNLDDYLSNFYEDNIEKKVASARNIMILMLDLKNLQTLIEHGNIPHYSRVPAAQSQSSTRIRTYQKHLNVCLLAMLLLFPLQLH